MNSPPKSSAEVKGTRTKFSQGIGTASHEPGQDDPPAPATGLTRGAGRSITTEVQVVKVKAIKLACVMPERRPSRCSR